VTGEVGIGLKQNIFELLSKEEESISVPE